MDTEISESGDRMSEVRKHFVFHGKVQGVGFRYTAKYLALSLGLTGWARNEWDGTVTMEVQGRETLINKLLVGLNQNQFISIEWIDTREIIVEILLSLEKGQDFSHKLMKAVLDKYDYLDPREKAFIKRVTEGNGVLKPEEMIGSDILEAGREKVHSLYGICVTDDNREAAKAEIVVLSVKPQYYEQTIAQIRDEITDEQVIVTLAPGKTLEWLQGQFGKDVKIVRTMPNTPAMVGAGMTAACANALVTKEELEKVLTILRSFGEVEVVSEHLIDAVVSASGSSPAYVFMMIEAMADAAVADGMPRPQAYKFAAQAVMGSAKMVLETGKHPGELKDMVCSPAGTTIEAVQVLEERGFRSAIIEAMRVCAEKSRNM